MATTDQSPPSEPRPTVAAAVEWSLHHLAAHRAALVGVEPGTDGLDFHVVPLRPDDPIADLGSLAVPDSWAILVVVLDDELIGGPPGVRLALGLDRRHDDGAGASRPGAGSSMSRRGGRCRTPAPPTRYDPR